MQNCLASWIQWFGNSSLDPNTQNVLLKGLPDVHVFLRLRSCRLQLSPFSLRGPSLPPFLLPRFPAESGLAECVCPSQRYPLWLRERATDRGDDGGGGERGPEAREMEGCTLG